MGTADIVPGVSGGTVALVLGIYERLIRNVHTGAQVLRALLTGDLDGTRTTFRQVEWAWLISLLVGVLAAIAVLSSILEELLHDEPVRMAALFFGLVVGSLTVAWRLIGNVGGREIITIVAVSPRSTAHVVSDAGPRCGPDSRRGHPIGARPDRPRLRVGRGR